jgi:hypothetical protein
MRSRQMNAVAQDDTPAAIVPPVIVAVRRATGAPAGAERGLRGPASDGEKGPRGRRPRI